MFKLHLVVFEIGILTMALPDIACTYSTNILIISKKFYLLKTLTLVKNIGTHFI
ncbi:hypothetical protein U3516DRAFT_749337 [Neocallimastix sp. 'constans']